MSKTDVGSPMVHPEIFNSNFKIISPISSSSDTDGSQSDSSSDHEGSAVDLTSDVLKPDFNLMSVPLDGVSQQESNGSPDDGDFDLPKPDFSYLDRNDFKGEANLSQRVTATAFGSPTKKRKINDTASGDSNVDALKPDFSMLDDKDLTKRTDQLATPQIGAAAAYGSPLKRKASDHTLATPDKKNGESASPATPVSGFRAAGAAACPVSPIKKVLPKTVKYWFPEAVPTKVNFGDHNAAMFIFGNLLEINFREKEALNEFGSFSEGTVFSVKYGMNLMIIQIAQTFPPKCPTHASVYIWINGQPLVFSQEFYLAFAEQPDITKGYQHLRLCQRIAGPSWDPNPEQQMYVYEFEELIADHEWLSTKTSFNFDQTRQQLFAFRDKGRSQYFTGMLVDMRGYSVGTYKKSMVFPHHLSIQQFLVHYNKQPSRVAATAANNLCNLWNSRVSATTAAAKPVDCKAVKNDDPSVSFGLTG